MKLLNPFKEEYTISQRFGENLNDFYHQAGLKGHQGVDFACPTGTPILATDDGTIVYLQNSITAGVGIYLMSNDKFSYNGKDCYYQTIYWHLKEDSIAVKLEQKVSAGDLLALSDNTGQSTGSHLHFGLMPYKTQYQKADPNNGYGGCIDPLPYMTLFKFTQNMKFGSKGNEVKELQIRFGLKPDGKFGIFTYWAVIKFQKEHGLIADGKVGPITLAELNKI